jgi:DNA-binding SARP family transcriptional activator/tetratricopeptide (TPR) repeat protein
MIRIRMLGGLSASRAGEAPGASAQARRLAVLALIARSGERGITRERLLAVLWPDSEEEAGRRALTQALHVLRRDLGAENLFLGVQELRLNDAVAVCDVLEFEAAMKAQAWDRAVSLYGGPFLDGFRLPGSAEFDRWMEEERDHLAHRHADGLERLAGAASERGDHAGAAGWWRRRAALDPLNGRVTLQLMQALEAAGERHAAVQQARIHETLLEQELALAPDAEVVSYAEELRRRGERRSGQTQSGTEPLSAGTPARLVEQSVEPRASPARPGRHHRRKAVAVVLLAVLVFLALAGTAAWRRAHDTAHTPLLAVGAVTDYRATTPSSAALTDMLATNLARVPGVNVLSSIRLLGLMADAGEPLTAAAWAAAARQAGATELLEGGIHSIEGGRLLLELRRVDLATGRVTAGYRLTGGDVFTLAEQATAEIAGSLGHSGVALDPADVSTGSLVAYRFYEEGLRRYVRGDYRGAIGLLQTALAEDSTFAMAGFYLLRARSVLNQHPDSAQIAWLARLAQRTSERERLQILGWLAFATQSAALDAIADTLAIRYPAEVEGQYLAGFARMAAADFLQALPFLHRVVTLDSSSVGTGRAICLACEAMQHLGYAYLALDSAPAAEQLARDWLRRDSASAPAWALLGSALDAAGRHEDAIAARKRAMAQVPYDAYDAVFPAAVRVRVGDFEAADQAMRAELANPRDEESSWQARWLLVISLRNQSRWREGSALLHESFATLTPEERTGSRGRVLKTHEAIIRLESDDPSGAAALLDSLTRHPQYTTEGTRARFLTIQYALLAEAAAAMGDREGVSRAADSAEAWGRRSGKTRDRSIAAHARAVRLLTAGDTVGAITGFREAIYSTTHGFTRSNLRLAGLLLESGRPREAVAPVSAALRGPLDSGGLYVTHRALHELLVRAYDALAQRDSAQAHRQWVSKARTAHPM